MTGPRILIIEDGEALRNAVVMITERSGYNVTAAIDGPAGTRALQHGAAGKCARWPCC